MHYPRQQPRIVVSSNNNWAILCASHRIDIANNALDLQSRCGRINKGALLPPRYFPTRIIVDISCSTRNIAREYPLQSWENGAFNVMRVTCVYKLNTSWKLLKCHPEIPSKVLCNSLNNLLIIFSSTNRNWFIAFIYIHIFIYYNICRRIK